jgi:hypothetical protein
MPEAWPPAGPGAAAHGGNPGGNAAAVVPRCSVCRDSPVRQTATTRTERSSRWRGSARTEPGSSFFALVTKACRSPA